MHAVQLCHYSAFAKVVSQALGGDDGDSSGRDPDRVNLADAPTYDAAIANINAALGFG
ncbi:hypothetical protein [Sphingomonas jaspsi]|uniref:hypothetical protein n=1 Tax=Sphingomonas jaspsi TaxID=392409 RepID=UPI0012EC0177|nr:hypothetical protein [Sphingomonas jaspsi]